MLAYGNRGPLDLHSEHGESTYVDALLESSYIA